MKMEFRTIPLLGLLISINLAGCAKKSESSAQIPVPAPSQPAPNSNEHSYFGKLAALGTWKANCKSFPNGSRLHSLSFADNNLTFTETIFTDSDCSSPEKVIYVQEFTVDEKENPAVPSGDEKRITLKARSKSSSAKITQAFTKLFSENKYFSHDAWATDVAVDVSGKSVVPNSILFPAAGSEWKQALILQKESLLWAHDSEVEMLKGHESNPDFIFKKTK